MATSRDESNPYGALGAGGKFRKKSYRRPPSTPYDRPPTAIRNPTIVPGAVGNSWLRKLVDPAHKLLATTAQRFYTSVFRKRLTQPPPSPSPPPQALEAKQEAGEKHEAPISLNISKEQEAASNSNLSFGPGGGSLKDLEEILKHSTFTRSEIDRLVALLHGRAVDNPVLVEEKTAGVLPSSSGLFHEQRDEVANIPLQDNMNGSHLISSKAINSSALDEDVGSPAELAKAYMGSRPSKMSPSMLDLRSQALAEDSAVPSSLVHPSKSPNLSLVPSSSGHVGVRENGYATLRSRGRSAIYGMARTPYSRVHVTSTLKSSEPVTDGYDGPSSSTQASEHKRSSGSSTKALKRSSSVFEHDISSGGSLRRIRQKPNLSYRRSWIMPISVAGEPSSSTQKIQSVSERKISSAEQSNVAPVSSKSTEMASKILEQLDKIVSPPKQRSFELKLAVAREKAPARLSPSKLKGQALKSLEHIDSSKFLEFGRDNNKPDDSFARSSHYSVEANEEKQDKIEQNGPSRTFAASDRLSPPVNGLENAMTIGRSEDVNSANSLSRSPIQSKHTFKMSAHEDFFDLEDDGYTDGISSSLVKVREKQDVGIVELKPSATQATVISEKHETVSEDQSHVNFFTKETTNQDADGKQVGVQTHTDMSFPTVPATSMSSQSSLLVVQSLSVPDKALVLKEPNAGPSSISSNDKIGGLKDQDVPTPIFGFVSNSESTTCNADKSPQLKFGISASADLSSEKTIPDTGVQSSSSGAPVAGGLFCSTEKVPESDNKKPLKDGAFTGVPDGSTVAPSSTASSATFTFGIKSTTSSNGPTVSTPISVDSTTVESQKPFSMPSFSVAFSGNKSSGELSSNITAATSSPALPIFRFGSSPSNSISQAPPPAVASEDAKTKEDTSSGKIIASSFVAAKSSPESSTFGFVPTSATSNGNNQKEASATTGAAIESAQVQESPATGTGLASFTENVSIQFGSSSSSMPSSTVVASTSGSLFGSSSAAKLFSSGTSFGSGKESSSEPTSLCQSSPSLFGQATTTPAFASSLTSKSPSTGFSFGSSTSSGSGFVFGCAPSSSSASSSASIFGLSSTSPLFGSTGASSASTATSIFGSTSTPPASAAASVFGSISTSSASSGASVFGSITASSTSSPFLGSLGASSGSSLSYAAASASPSSGPTFSFTSAAASPSPPPVFGGSSSPFTFGSPAPVSNNSTDQMNMEDSMAEDTVQAVHSSILPAPVFGQQQPVSPPAGFMFGSNAAAGANQFQFGAQQNLSTPQSPSPFQASGSLDFTAGGGSFSLGTGGGDKSARKIVKINRNKQRRK